jgi:hypothetical protein
MMRSQAQAHLFPFDSSDSTNVAMNHNRQFEKSGETIAMFAGRVDAKIQKTAGPEADHQVKRPLLEHVAAFDRDLARAMAPGADDVDRWMFAYRHGFSRRLRRSRPFEIPGFEETADDQAKAAPRTVIIRELTRIPATAGATPKPDYQPLERARQLNAKARKTGGL